MFRCAKRTTVYVCRPVVTRLDAHMHAVRCVASSRQWDSLDNSAHTCQDKVDCMVFKLHAVVLPILLFLRLTSPSDESIITLCRVYNLGR